MSAIAGDLLDRVLALEPPAFALLHRPHSGVCLRRFGLGWWRPSVKCEAMGRLAGINRTIRTSFRGWQTGGLFKSMANRRQ